MDRYGCGGLREQYYRREEEVLRGLPKTHVSAEECQRRLQTSSASEGIKLELEHEDSWQEFTYSDFSQAIRVARGLVWVTDDVFVGPSIKDLRRTAQGGTYERTMCINGVPVFTIPGGSSRKAVAILINFAVQRSGVYHGWLKIRGENNHELPLSEALMTEMVASGTVEHLELHECHLDGDQSRVLAQASMVAKLEFRKCTLSNNGQEFVKAMSSNQTPPALHIDDETNIDLDSLGHCLRSNTSVEKLSFRNWKREESARLPSVFEGLAENRSIQDLDLSFTMMDLGTWMALCQRLVNQCSLLYLNLSRTLPSTMNEVDSRLRALETILESNTIIQDIVVSLREESRWAPTCHVNKFMFARLELNCFRARVNAMTQSAHRNLEFRVAYHEDARYDKSKLYLLLRGNVDFICTRNVPSGAPEQPATLPHGWTEPGATQSLATHS